VTARIKPAGTGLRRHHRFRRWIRPRLVLENLEQEHPAIAAERPLPRQQLIKDDPEAVQVGARVHLMRLPPRLLRRHVRRRAQHLAVEGHGNLFGLALCQAEVHEMRPALQIEQDVGRLDVAMNDAVLVGVRERLADLGDQLGGLAKVRAARRQAPRQCRAGDELLDQVPGAVARLACIVQRHDPGVLELGGATGLAQEAIHIIPTREPPSAEDLDGNRAVEFDIAGAEDVTEGADPKLLQQLELAQPTRSVAGEPTPFLVAAARRPRGLEHDRGNGRLGAVPLVQLRHQGVRHSVKCLEHRLACGASLDVPGHAFEHRPGEVTGGELGQFSAAGAAAGAHGTRLVHRNALAAILLNGKALHEGKG
jgi:hypothetical protein